MSVLTAGPMAMSFAVLALLTLGCAHPGDDSGTRSATGPAKPLPEAPEGPFGYSMVASEDGRALDIDGFMFNEECESCHERHAEEIFGGMHGLAHTDPLYRRSAELARAEAGEEIYTFCSGCHSPQGVASGLIPATPESELPEIATAGVLCDVCHQISQLTGPSGPWGEQGNASFVLSPNEERKFGPTVGDNEIADHDVETREFLTSSEFCASCHTVIHPLNGLRLERTYEEWKASIYAQKGIQCQDCHMRSVEDAIEVAETLTRVSVLGLSEPTGDEREISPHFFSGANANAELLGGSSEYAATAEKRLRSAAKLEIESPAAARPGEMLRFDVRVHNVGAGHSLPTGVIELREMWVDLRVLAKGGNVLYHSGGLEANGSIPKGAMHFGAIAADARGEVTHKPWEVAQFVFKRLVPARGSESNSFEVALPQTLKGPLRIEARLYYRSASPEAVASLMGEEALELKQVEMARAEAAIEVQD